MTSNVIPYHNGFILEHFSEDAHGRRDGHYNASRETRETILNQENFLNQEKQSVICYDSIKKIKFTTKNACNGE